MSEDPIQQDLALQKANNFIRAEQQRLKAEPVLSRLLDEPRVQEAIRVAKQHNQRRLIRVFIAIDESGKAMQATVVHKPISPKRKRL